MAVPSMALAVPISSSATTSSSGRSKVSLKPGRSLMDWIRFSNSVKDLASTGGKLLEVSTRELAKHNKSDDAWIALRGRVYNITQYLEYHPGGEDELMRGAGKDATDLFNQVHRWVNVESMLQKCLIGVLKKSWILDVPKFPQIKPFKSKNKDQAPNGCSKEISSESNKCTKVSQTKSDWSVLTSSTSDLSEMSTRVVEYEDSLKLEISSSNIKKQGLITDLVEKNLYVKINNLQSYFLNIALSTRYQEHYKVTVEDGSKLEFVLKKYNLKTFNSQSTDDCVKFTLCNPKNEFVYWACKLINKTPINHNTFLFTFLLPPGTEMWVPIGCHVQFKFNVEGTDVTRNYTPVCSSLNPNVSCDDKLDGSKIVFMIKIYTSGTLTPVLNRYSLGDHMLISNYSGNFSNKFIESGDSITMLAAGTGITPMIQIIKWAMADVDVKRSLHLLFFNRTEDDILWRKELEDCKSIYNDFRIDHILSKPSLKWRGYTGLINEDILKQLITVKSTLINQRFLICGPLSFTQASLSCLKGAGYNEEDLYAFVGV